MRKKKPEKQYNIDLKMPDEINALKALVKEFISKIETLDNEIALLQQDKKEITEEYSEKLDLKTLNAALKVLKIKATVEHADTYDLFEEVLKDPAA